MAGKLKTIIALTPIRVKGTLLQIIFSWKLIKKKNDKIGIPSNLWPQSIPKKGIYVCEIAINNPDTRKLKSRTFHVKHDLSDLEAQVKGFVHTIAIPWIENEYGSSFDKLGGWDGLTGVLRVNIRKK